MEEKRERKIKEDSKTKEEIKKIEKKIKEDS